MKTFSAVLHKEEDMYIADCPEVGTVSQGGTIEETIENLREATELSGFINCDLICINIFYNLTNYL